MPTSRRFAKRGNILQSFYRPQASPTVPTSRCGCVRYGRRCVSIALRRVPPCRLMAYDTATASQVSVSIALRRVPPCRLAGFELDMRALTVSIALRRVPPCRRYADMDGLKSSLSFYRPQASPTVPTKTAESLSPCRLETVSIALRRVPPCRLPSKLCEQKFT